MKDKCVVCKEDSVYDLDENIICRLAYIIGVGQLCFECYDEIYIKSKTKIKEKKDDAYSDSHCLSLLEINDQVRLYNGKKWSIKMARC